MAEIIEEMGYWVAAPYGDGWTTFKRENEDGTKTIWNEMARDYCPLDANGVMISSVHPFYIRVKDGIVLNCENDLWKIVPHQCFVYAIDEAVVAGWTLKDGVFAPPPPPPYVPIELQRSVLLARLTEDEFEALDISVEDGETRKVYKTFDATLVYIEGSAMWELLVKHLTLTVTAERMAVLLARPVQGAAMVDEAGEIIAA